MFTMNKFWEVFFTGFTFVTQGASYLSPYVYGIIHRMHHDYADTEKDPHSPKYDKTLFAMMWKTKSIFSGILKGKIEVDPKYTKGLPNTKKFDYVTNMVPIRLIWVGVYVWFYSVYATHWWMYLLIPIHALMGPIHGAIINWYAHKYGYTNFKLRDTSKNLMAWDIFMMGEGLHNNHHKLGGRPKFSVKKHEFDPSYPFIWLFDKLGIIHFKRRSQDIAY